ncbi:MAG TPA: TIM-barrel domain-containing protein, partial [Myxococcales bacterium]|nr:TIM-barrel domain-containing protein [Myxococcales bacterium]
RGLRFTFWNTDVVPHHPDTDPLYASIPFFVSLLDGRAAGVLLDEPWRSEVDVALAEPDCVRWESSGPELDVYVLCGPDFGGVLERYTALTGRAPLPPLWSLGAQQSRYGYESARDVHDVVSAYRDHGLPLDVVHLDIDYMEGFEVFTWERSRYPEPAALVKEVGQKGVKLVTIVDPGVRVRDGYRVWDDGRARGMFVRQDRGDVLVGEVWPERAAYPDLTRPEVQSWWAGWHREFLEAGIAGFWNDMNEPSCFHVEKADNTLVPSATPLGLHGDIEGKTLPYDARHGEKRHIEVHNVYGLGMCKGTFEAFTRYRPEKRPWVLTRAGYAGIQRYAAMWTGDNSSHWSHLEMSVSMLLGLGLSGVPFVGVDVPGFLGRPSGELLVRWMQAAAFYPLFRNHSSKGTPPKEPWRFGAPVLSLARQALERRYRMLPALYTLLREASVTGAPVLRPLVWHAPGDRAAVAAFDELLFGPDLLVAPVLRPGQTKRLTYLPRGRWLPFPNLGPVAGRLELVDGPTHLIADAPLEQTPCWLREGGGLALTEPRLHTTTANWDALEWHLVPGQTLRASLYEDEGDGYGAARVTELRGRREEGSLVLERQVAGTLPPVREHETLHVYGVPGGVQAKGADVLSAEPGHLVLRVPASWTRVELTGGGGS